MACYCSLLDRCDEAKGRFKKAILIHEETVQRNGIDDPDLRWPVSSINFKHEIRGGIVAS